MRRTQKILSIILAILMMISIIPIIASAATPTSGTCGDNLTWTYNSSDGYLTISGTGAMYDYKSNNRPWESYEDKIKSVFIDNGITKIGNYAFYSCENIINVELSSTVIVIGESAFCSCKKLSTITIPYGVTTIEYRAFGSCTSLTNITMPNSITTIGQNAFISCTSLTNITIPDSVITIEKTAFVHCENLLSIIVDENNQYYSNDKYGVLFNKDKTTLIYYPGGSTSTNYTVPKGTLTIGDSAFVYACELISVTFADGLIRIGKYAFDGCDRLTTVIIPDSVTEIGYSAFVEWSHEPAGNLTDVYYTGTEEQWKSILIDDYNNRLVNATIHYNSIGPHIHDYESVVTAPTCTERGYTTYTCECGDSYIDDYVNNTGHSYTSAITTPATHTATGVMTYTCTCGDSYTEVIAKLEKHNYESAVTAPTCTEQGYTTYTCKCGDSYIADYVNALGHTEEIIPAVAPTCTETGLTEGTKCSVCGETLTEQKELPANGHTLANAVEENYVTPTCTENGSKDVVTYCSVCDEEISRETETLDATGHADNDGDGYCDMDDELLDPAVECDHNCHKTGISGFIWKIINFFNKLFGFNKTCQCGVTHY